MGQMQDKIMVELRRIAEKEFELDFVDQPQYANTGTVFVQRNWETLLKLGYRFNAAYAGFDFSGGLAQACPAVRSHRLWKSPGGGLELPYTEYAKKEAMDELFGLYRAILEGSKGGGGD